MTSLVASVNFGNTPVICLHRVHTRTCYIYFWNSAFQCSIYGHNGYSWNVTSLNSCAQPMDYLYFLRKCQCLFTPNTWTMGPTNVSCIAIPPMERNSYRRQCVYVRGCDKLCVHFVWTPSQFLRLTDFDVLTLLLVWQWNNLWIVHASGTVRNYTIDSTLQFHTIP